MRVWGMGVCDCGDCMKNGIIHDIAMAEKKIDNIMVRYFTAYHTGSERFAFLSASKGAASMGADPMEVPPMLRSNEL